MTPSSWHGVTTAVFGNCGVGFAPVRPGSEDFLINLMEGVEDIQGSVLAEGIDFSWQSYPEYLDVLGSMPRVPHGALRFYVMGERGADHNEIPDAGELLLMEKLVVEAFAALTYHKAADGRLTRAQIETLGCVFAKEIRSYRSALIIQVDHERR